MRRNAKAYVTPQSSLSLVLEVADPFMPVIEAESSCGCLSWVIRFLLSFGRRNLSLASILGTVRSVDSTDFPILKYCGNRVAPLS